MFSPTTPSSRLRRRRAAAASASCASAGRGARSRAALADRARAARAAPRDVRAHRAATGATAADRSGRRHVLPGAALLHRRRRRRDQRARQSGAAARDRRGGDATRARGWRSRASSRCARSCNGRIDLVQAEAVADLIDAVTPLQARAAFDQLEGTLTARDRARSTRALFDLVARLEASLDFPDEGYHFIEPRRRGARASTRSSADSSAAGATPAAAA